MCLQSKTVTPAERSCSDNSHFINIALSNLSRILNYLCIPSILFFWSFKELYLKDCFTCSFSNDKCTVATFQYQIYSIYSLTSLTNLISENGATWVPFVAVLILPKIIFFSSILYTLRWENKTCIYNTKIKTIEIPMQQKDKIQIVWLSFI